MQTEMATTSSTLIPIGRIGLVGLVLSSLILLALGLTKNCILYWTVLLMGILVSLGLVLMDRQIPAAVSFFSASVLIFFVAMGLYLGGVC